MQAEPRLPDVVEKEALEAEELFKKLWEAPDEQSTSDETTEEDSDESSEDTDEDTQESKEEPNTNSDSRDEDDFKKWKERYLSLKGKYDAEVPRLSHELRELKERVSSISDKEKEDKRKLEQQKETEEFESFKETYGEAFVEKIQKLVEKQFEDKISPYKKEIESVKEDSYKTMQAAFIQQLDSKADGWRDLWEGKDPRFAEFLTQPDPSGLYTYADLLSTYNERWDSDKMARIFNLYKEQNKPHKKPTDSQRKLDIPESHVTPARSTSQPSPQDNRKKIWSESDISKFMLDERQGKYTADEAEKIWDDILAAPSEGRVR